MRRKQLLPCYNLCWFTFLVPYNRPTANLCLIFFTSLSKFPFSASLSPHCGNTDHYDQSAQVQLLWSLTYHSTDRWPSLYSTPARLHSFSSLPPSGFLATTLSSSTLSEASHKQFNFFSLSASTFPYCCRLLSHHFIHSLLRRFLAMLPLGRIIWALIRVIHAIDDLVVTQHLTSV